MVQLKVLMFLRKKQTRQHADGELHLGSADADKFAFASQSQKLPWFKRVHQFLSKKKGLGYFCIALLLIVTTGVGLLIMLAQYKEPKIPIITTIVKKKVPEPKKFYSPLTGNEVADEAATKRAVTAIMLENSPDARPQSGLKDSGVVYEAIAEGGITRFLAIYQEQQPGLIGPVRSVRPYYIDWAAPYDASIAHIGGSYNALQEVRNGQYRDIDQFFNAGAYYRASDRYAPHNVYTTFERLNALNAAKGYTTSTFTGFVRAEIPNKTTPKPKVKTPVPPALATANTIQVNISSGLYNSSYTYDGTNKFYVRNQAGGAHTDREAGQITPKVVIVIKVPTVLGFEDGYREQMQTIGSGEGYVFQNGTVQGVSWNKADKKTQLRFLDAAGKDVPLERGQTWITAIGTDRTVTWQ